MIVKGELFCGGHQWKVGRGNERLLGGEQD
jgi:hypothetical protein